MNAAGKRRTILVKNGSAPVQERWVGALATLLPEFQVRGHDDPDIDGGSVDYIVGWCPDARWVNSFASVKALISIGSGVDHITNLAELRSEIPVIRTVAPELIQRMREYVALCILAWHRKLLPMIDANSTRTWTRFAEPVASDIQVGILGYGGMGSAAARTLVGLGYSVRLWANSDRENVEYPYFHGAGQLTAFATGCDAIVCLLPLTEQTRGILNKSVFDKMNADGCVVNAARGEHLDEADLRDAVDSGQIGRAFLDGLPQEPLPDTSPTWNIPRTLITGHSAAYISPQAGPQIIAANIKKFDSGQAVSPMYDPVLGY